MINQLEKNKSRIVFTSVISGNLGFTFVPVLVFFDSTSKLKLLTNFK